MYQKLFKPAPASPPKKKKTNRYTLRYMDSDPSSPGFDVVPKLSTPSPRKRTLGRSPTIAYDDELDASPKCQTRHPKDVRFIYDVRLGKAKAFNKATGGFIGHSLEDWEQGGFMVFKFEDIPFKGGDDGVYVWQSDVTELEHVQSSTKVCKRPAGVKESRDDSDSEDSPSDADDSRRKVMKAMKKVKKAMKIAKKPASVSGGAKDIVKLVYSKAYHRASSKAKAKGLSHEKVKVAARKAGQKAVQSM